MDALTEQQNKIRGIIAEYKSARFQKVKTNGLLTFRNHLRLCLMQARAALSKSEAAPYLVWLDEQIITLLPDHRRTPIGFDYLSGLYDGPPVSIERELSWIVSRLLHEHQTINAFRKIATQVETYLLEDRHADAILALAEASKIVGETFWGIQTRIAVETLSGGLEAQKKYTDQVKSQFRRGVLTYIAYHTSVRNEERTTLAKYAENLEARISGSKRFTPDIKNYVRYRLLGQWFPTEEAVCDVLRLENNHSACDLYETLIAFCQHAVRERDKFEFAHSAMRHALLQLSKIDDFRIHKLLIALGHQTDAYKLPERDTAISDHLLAGSLLLAVRASLIPATSRDPWTTIYKAFSLAEIDSGRPKKGLTRVLALVFRQDIDAIDHFVRLEKLAINLVGIPFYAAILDALRLIRADLPHKLLNTSIIGLNSPTIGIEDIDWAFKPATEIVLHETRSSRPSPTSLFWGAAAGIVELSPEMPPTVSALCHGLHLCREGHHASAVPLLDDALSVRSVPGHRLISSLYSLAAIESANWNAIIRHYAIEAASNSAVSFFQPFTATMARQPWPVYKAIGDEIYVPNFLYLLWQEQNDDRVASLLRFSIGYFLKKNGIRRPADLFDCDDFFGQANLVFFLRFVCMPNLMDMARVFQNSREVFEERRQICAVLKTLDPTNSDIYDDEILFITNEMTIADGLQIVDRSRISVDTDAITRWAERTQTETFERYRDLAKAGIGTEANFDDVLREFESNQKSPNQPFFTPESEADSALVELYGLIGDQFLNNGQYGLDYYLSKRIRHQSFIGLIRSPAEFSGIITTRPSESAPYNRNEFWLSKLESLSEEGVGQIDQAFTTFAKKFDDLLIDAKDQYFHIRTPEKPQGLFQLRLTAPALIVARTVSRHDATIGQFLTTAFQIFWGALEFSLEAARKHISEDLKTGIVTAFYELNAAVRQIAGDDPQFLNLSTAINTSATEVQQRLDEAAAWFKRPEIQQINRYFTLKQMLDIAIESSLKSHRAFQPEIQSEAYDDGYQMAALNLAFIADVIFVALDNIKSHCSHRKPPKVTIVGRIDGDTETLTLEITNPIEEKMVTDEHLKGLQEIRDLIRNRATEKRSKKEGKSGFLKLAATVQQSDKGRIEFGVVNEKTFRLFLQYSFVTIHKVNTSSDAHENTTH